MGAQTVAKPPIGRNDDIVVRLKGDEYSVTNEPLGKRVLENIDNQIASLEIFTSFFHRIVVIGLQRKNTTIKSKRQSLKGRKECSLFPQISTRSVDTSTKLTIRIINLSSFLITSWRGHAFSECHATDCNSTGERGAGHRIAKSVLL